MNSSFIHADIFFYVTTISVVLLTVLLIIFLYYVVGIARHLEHTSKRLMEESDAIIADVSTARKSIKNHGGKLFSAIKFILTPLFYSKFSSTKKESKSKKNN